MLQHEVSGSSYCHFPSAAVEPIYLSVLLQEAFKVSGYRLSLGTAIYRSWHNGRKTLQKVRKPASQREKGVKATAVSRCRVGSS